MPRVELARAETFLQRRYGGRARDVAPLGTGYWSAAYSFALDGRGLVVRFGKWRSDFEKDRFVRSFDGPALPVPEVLEIGDLEGGSSASSVRYHGRFLEQLDPSSAGWLLPALLGTLDAIRLAPVPTAAGLERTPDGRPADGSWEEFLAPPRDIASERVSRWWPVIAASPALEELFGRAGEAVRAIVDSGACPDIRHLLHLDLLNRNVLVDEEGRRISAVYDWGCMAYGDFVYEIGWLSFWAPFHPVVAALDIREAAVLHFRDAGLEVPGFTDRLHCYELHVGLVHLAYAAFSRVKRDIEAVADRISQVLTTT